MDNSPHSEQVYQGVPAAPGQALAPLLRYHRPAPAPPAAPITRAAIPAAQEQVRRALTAAEAELLLLARQLEKTVGADEAAIFTAQSLMAADPGLVDRALELVTELCPAPEAIRRAADEQAAVLAGLGDAYLAARAADLQDVGARAARLATGQAAPTNLTHLAAPAIILAADLSPSETAGLDRAHVRGLALAGGGPGGHAAILARALGVPLVCGLGTVQGRDGQAALLDGATGLLVLDPAPGRIRAYQALQTTQAGITADLAALRDQPAITSDGHRVRLLANVGAVAEAGAVAGVGAEGIGLLRTEFLFLDHRPTDEEQVAAYQAIYAAVPGEVIVRTMDLGGDKPPPYLDFSGEANPFLGWRGIRIGLDTPDLLQSQLRAILRAGAGRAVQIMFPMIGTLDEWRRARAAVDIARAALVAAGLPCATDVKVGIMVEVPAAALLAPAFAAEADFFSIGTNDLTQYTLAVDRGAARVAALYSPLQPAVLQLIARTVEGAHGAGKPVGMCGEAAGNPAWAALWLGLGLDELSMAPPALPPVKAAIRRTTLVAAQALAAAALQATTVAEVEALLHEA